MYSRRSGKAFHAFRKRRRAAGRCFSSCNRVCTICVMDQKLPPRVRRSISSNSFTSSSIFFACWKVCWTIQGLNVNSEGSFLMASW